MSVFQRVRISQTLLPDHSGSYLKQRNVIESEDYFVYSVLASWDARLIMGWYFIFRMSFQHKAFCSWMHDRRGMCPKIMVFLPKKEFWLRGFFGKSLHGVFYYDTCGLIGIFLHEYIQFNPRHPVYLPLLVSLVSAAFLSEEIGH